MSVFFDMGSMMKYCRQIERSRKKENIYYLLTCEVVKTFLGDPVKIVHLLPLIGYSITYFAFSAQSQSIKLI